MRILGEVLLYKDPAATVEIQILKLRAAGYQVARFDNNLVCDEDPNRKTWTLMIWKDFPGTGLGTCKSAEGWAAMCAFCNDIDDVIEGPHDDDRMKSAGYGGIVQAADFVPADFVPAYADDFGAEDPRREGDEPESAEVD